MKIRSVVRHAALMLVIGLTLAAVPRAAAQGGEQTPAAAQLEIHRARLAELRQKLSDRHPDIVRARAEIATLETRLAAALAAEPSQVKGVAPPPRRGFNIVLLLGDMVGPDGQDGIPTAARKALADMKDFLPYKAYRLLDTQWIIGASSGAAVTRLRGVDEQEYELELRASPLLTPATAAVDPGGLSVRFVLRESAEIAKTLSKADGEKDALRKHDVTIAQAEVDRELFQLERERVDLTQQIPTLRGKVDVGTADPQELKRQETQLRVILQRMEELKMKQQQMKQLKDAAPVTARAVIDTSFRMDEGETVVVGSSGVKGTKRALIALLTAAAPPARTR